MYYNAQFWSDFKSYFLSHLWRCYLDLPHVINPACISGDFGRCEFECQSVMKEVFYNLNKIPYNIRSLFGFINLPVIVNVNTGYTYTTMLWSQEPFLSSAATVLTSRNHLTVVVVMIVVTPFQTRIC